MTTSANANRRLALLKSSASTSRVLNLPWIQERYRDEPDLRARPLFVSQRLNECIIIKHPLQPHERKDLQLNQANATKIVLPFASTDLGMGGYAAFLEERGFDNSLRELLGVAPGTPAFVRDCVILKELARLPSLDPYLLRERFKRLGFAISPCYFEVSEADIRELQRAVAADIGLLVHLAYGSDGDDAKPLAAKLAHLLLTDDMSDALIPLRDTLRLSTEQHDAAMFGWKGFLYYKWLVSSMRLSFRPVISEILSARIAGGDKSEITRLGQIRSRIATRFSKRVQQIETALQSYDDAFSSLVGDGKPGAFRKFLLDAPQMFLDTGSQLAAVNHITSFWRQRYPTAPTAPLELEDAFDLFREFETSLSDTEEIIEI